MAFGGLADDAGFNVSAGPTGMVVGFSLSGGVIPSGSSGVLTTIQANPYPVASQSCISELILADVSGGLIDSYLYTECIQLCDDQDQDGICDYSDDCIGEYDDCEVCNGDSTSCQNVFYLDNIDEVAGTMDLIIT